MEKCRATDDHRLQRLDTSHTRAPSKFSMTSTTALSLRTFQHFDVSSTFLLAFNNQAILHATPHPASAFLQQACSLWPFIGMEASSSHIPLRHPLGNRGQDDYTPLYDLKRLLSSAYECYDPERRPMENISPRRFAFSDDTSIDFFVELFGSSFSTHQISGCMKRYEVQRIDNHAFCKRNLVQASC